MRKNLLLALLAILFGVTAAVADNVNINVDNAANVEVTYGYSGAQLVLENGMNRVTTLTAADSPLAIRAVNGAEIVSVTKNGTDAVTPSGDGVYRLSIEPMMVDIVTSGGGGEVIPDYNVYFTVDPNALGKFTANYGENSVIINEAKYWQLPAVPVTLRPVAGYRITDVRYAPDWMTNVAVNNGDGSWTFTPEADYSSVEVTVLEEGTMFNVDVNLDTNILVLAWMKQPGEWTTEGNVKFLTLSGTGPYTAVAPKEAAAVGFLPAEGGVINNIIRVQPNGDKGQISNSAYTGWCSTVSEGDTFIATVQGPEVELTVVSGSDGIAADKFVVSVAGEVAAFTAENPVVKAHAGDVVTVAGARGYELTSIYTDCGRMITSNGPVQSFMITGSGTVYAYGAAVSTISINIDNAQAVKVTDRNGYGKVVELTDGNNVLSEVSNPLQIAPVEGYLIKSVVLDGEPIKANADGTYTAAIESGSTLLIETEKKPEAYPVTVALTGEYEWLTVTNDGEYVTLSAENSTLRVEPGAELTFAPVKGYLLKQLTTTNGLFAAYDEDDDVWTVTVNGPGSVVIVMEEWVAGENNVLIDYSINDSYRVASVVYNPEGEWYAKLNVGLNEVPKDGTIELSISSFSDFTFTEVLFNGEAIAATENGKLCRIAIKEAGKLEVTVDEPNLVEVTGFNTSDPETHTIIGDVYVNTVGEYHYKAEVGETVTLIPVPAPGYRFAGFEWGNPDYILSEISTSAPYTLVVPDGLDYIMVRGAFVKDEENPSYNVHTYLAYVNGYEYSDLNASAFVRFLTPEGVETNDALVLEGDQIELLCYVENESYQCVNFCMYTNPTKVVPQIYTVDGKDANEKGVIELSAYVQHNDVAAETVAADALRYDSASATLYTPEDARVFTLGGQLVKSVVAGSADLSGLPAGIYVVVTPEATLKIAR